jgi:ribonuclease BN (tRNA processing enzyme)
MAAGPDEGARMYVRFWGTRGSIATPGPQTAHYGGNTACVEVRSDGGTLIVLDCGTGARALGGHLVRAEARPLRLHLLLSHTHWDHIQGFPFFEPAFLPDTDLQVYAPRDFHHGLEAALAGQMQYPYFTHYLNHPAPTMAYRLSCGGATLAPPVPAVSVFPRQEVAGGQHRPESDRNAGAMLGRHLIAVRFYLVDDRLTQRSVEGREQEKRTLFHKRDFVNARDRKAVQRILTFLENQSRAKIPFAGKSTSTLTGGSPARHRG